MILESKNRGRYGKEPEKDSERDLPKNLNDRERTGPEITICGINPAGSLPYDTLQKSRYGILEKRFDGPLLIIDNFRKNYKKPLQNRQ